MAASSINATYCSAGAAANQGVPFANGSDGIGVSNGIGNGMKNTNYINTVCQAGAFNEVAGYTVIVDGSDYDDWYAPTESELNIAKGNIALRGYFWRSDGTSGSNAGIFSQAWRPDRAAGMMLKANTYQVRPTRAF